LNDDAEQGKDAGSQDHDEHALHEAEEKMLLRDKDAPAEDDTKPVDTEHDEEALEKASERMLLHPDDS
jgi:hypothetical protein